MRSLSPSQCRPGTCGSSTLYDIIKLKLLLLMMMFYNMIVTLTNDYLLDYPKCRGIFGEAQSAVFHVQGDEQLMENRKVRVVRQRFGVLMMFVLK